MKKKVLAWFVLLSFSLFTWSCVIYKWKKEPLESIRPEEGEGIKLSAVQIKSGEKIELNKKPAAKFQANSVVGEQFFNNAAIEKLTAASPKYYLSGTPFLIAVEGGKTYRVTSWADVKNKTILKAYVPLSIPLSDIDFAWVREVNILVTLSLDVLTPVAFVYVIYGLMGVPAPH